MMKKLSNDKSLIARYPIQIGLFLGLLGVFCFSLSLPATRYLSPFLSSWDIGLGRGIIASSIAGVLLFIKPKPLPTMRQAFYLLLASGGIVYGFPLLTAVGMKTVPAHQGAIILGALPLLTALCGTIVTKERPSLSFWLVSLCGLFLIICFSLVRHQGAGLSISLGDGALFGAVVLASLGYAIGGRIGKEMPGWRVVCWIMVLSSPMTVLLWVKTADFAAIAALSQISMLVLLFLGMFCSLIGFFFWYGGFAIAGIARVSQIQYLQTFLTVFASVVLLDEKLDQWTLIMMFAVIGTLILSQRMRAA